MAPRAISWCRALSVWDEFHLKQAYGEEGRGAGLPAQDEYGQALVWRSQL